MVIVHKVTGEEVILSDSCREYENVFIEPAKCYYKSEYEKKVVENEVING